MRCSVCGADNLEGAAYCEDCGAPTPNRKVAPAPQVPPAPEPVVPIVAPVTPSAHDTPAPQAGGGPVNCAACGARNLPNVAFCEDCGASLTSGGSPPSPGAHDAPVSYDPPVAQQAPPTPAGRRIRLVLTSGKEFSLDKDTILIGRRSPVDGIFPEVDLTDHDTESYISRRHAKLLLGEGGIVFEDLGSSNGSFVNGTKMQSGVQQAVHDGDNLRLGKTEMVLRCN